MRERALIIRHLVLAGLLCMTVSACTITETVGKIIGSTSDFTSSTSPSSWFTGDGVLKADQKVIAFVAFNFENLKQDMAKGRGEYLTSLSELFGVPQDRRDAFFSFAQSRYRLAKSGRGAAEDLVALLAPDQS
jgi:hypothetical protein